MASWGFTHTNSSFTPQQQSSYKINNRVITHSYHHSSILSPPLPTIPLRYLGLCTKVLNPTMLGMPTSVCRLTMAKNLVGIWTATTWGGGEGHWSFRDGVVPQNNKTSNIRNQYRRATTWFSSITILLTTPLTMEIYGNEKKRSSIADNITFMPDIDYNNISILIASTSQLNQAQNTQNVPTITRLDNNT